MNKPTILLLIINIPVEGLHRLKEKFCITGDKGMEKLLYVMFIERSKLYNKINKAMVIKHVEHIKKLDDSGKLVLCGPLKGYPGVAAMIILKTDSYEEAEEMCKSEPFVAEGYATYKLCTLRVGDRDNNYLL